jgi:two-component system chemotaxis response regulator CheY
VSASAGVVLLVEDDEDLRTTLVEVLRDQGVDVAEAGNGLEALAWMKSHASPSVIVLDLMMPKMDGLQFRTAQLEDPALAAVPVVFMTASTITQSLLDDTGAAGVLRKPVSLEQLFAALRPWVPLPSPPSPLP